LDINNAKCVVGSGRDLILGYNPETTTREDRRIQTKLVSTFAKNAT